MIFSISVEDFFELSISTLWFRSCVMFLESTCACHSGNRETQFLLCGYGLIMNLSAPVKFVQTTFIDVNCTY